ncbi:MAG: (4Fe-4S)-binding protein [Reichenbachiella sp.]|uniref:(4Fe-4S)-binding protein n=1 Tax=Reichenbachiella sp. TaxID=2184521 RepID=UPI003297F473
MAIKHYSNDKVTVKWQSELCIHSEKCFHGLPKVFNPKERPWINIDGANSEEIIAQVGKCPSGALSIANEDQKTTVSQETIVETMPNGPLMVYGNMKIKHAGEETVKDSKATAFCRCGASENKPYCDGSHKKNDFVG